MSIFSVSNMLLPEVESMEKWSVIACDQFTSQPEYWTRVREFVGNEPSTLQIILPEAELSENNSERIEAINATMKKYVDSGVFKEYQQSFVYVERTLVNGELRKGIVGMVDLDEYDYSPDAVSAIRATEQTVVDRIPPRMEIRRNASLELPHILLLCDDERKQIIETAQEMKQQLPMVYDFELMESGGHISGWLLQGEYAQIIMDKLAMYMQETDEKYAQIGKKPMYFAVGDGNHSLATAKACYEELKANHPQEDLSMHPARFALVELGNIHEESLVFEPIHRIVKGTDVELLMRELEQQIGGAEGYPITWFSGNQSGTIMLNKELGELPVGILQGFLDKYLSEHAGECDYIHGEDAVEELARKPETVGFLLPAMGKGQLFKGIIADGVLPRKTFSMGHAQEKRYYLEARKIVE